MTVSVETLRDRAQAFTEDVSRETYLAHAGLKATAELQVIYARYPELFGDDALQLCLEDFRRASEGSDERRAARMMLDWQVDAQVGERLAELDEREIELEGSAIVRLDDGTVVGYQSVQVEIMNEGDRARRNALDVARAAVAGETFAPLRVEHLEREKEYVEALGIAPGYNVTFEVLSGVSLDGLAGQCAAFLRDTEAMWGDVIGERLATFGVPKGEATRADALALFRLREFDDAFPASGMEEAIRRNCADMGIDATAGGRIIFDLGEREGKRSRAFCAPVRVPDEVYLVMRPFGGQTDYNTMLHELGHALHFGYARADYPFEYRWLGDNSVTEGYAMLFDHRMQDRGWLTRYTGLGKGRVAEFLRHAALEELHFLRRYCAKLLYEVQVYGGGHSWDALADLYVDTLGGATGFAYRREDAFVDLDPHYYSTRYLRAWQLQAALDDVLTDRFNEDWWRNPAAGPWIVGELFGEGQRETADELAVRVGANGALGFAPIIRQVEALLAT